MSILEINKQDKETEVASFLKAGAIDSNAQLLFPNEPSRFLPRDLERFFIWATEQGASDITFQTLEQVFLEIYGKKYRVTNRKISQSEMQEIIVGMYESESAKAKLNGIEDLDFAYEIKPERGVRIRFRVNATAISVEGNTGIQITARSIPSKPVEIKNMNLEKEIFENLYHKQGMIVVTGGTGSGKSTLLSSIIRYISEDPNSHKKILTYESPIEFVYDEIEKPSTSISQSEIGKHLRDFASGTRNALRRKPDIILIGEARDAETIGEAVTASMTGHLLYTTVHSNGFADTIRRMVNVFPEGERNSKAVDIISSLKMVVSQRLVPSLDGKRVALREFVVFNDHIIDLLLEDLDNLTYACRKVLKLYGRSFILDATEKYNEGKISEQLLKEFERSEKGTEKDVDLIKEKTKEKALKMMGDSLEEENNKEDGFLTFNIDEMKETLKGENNGK